MKNLLILGAGQYGCLVKEIAESIGCFGKIDFLDDNSEKAIGRLNDYVGFADRYDCAVVAIGNPELRLRYLEELKCHFDVPVLVHPKSYVSPSAKVGMGSIVEPMAVIHTDTVIGKGCLICAGAVINHNAVLGDGCHADCNSTVAARAEVTPCTKVCLGEVFYMQK